MRPRRLANLTHWLTRLSVLLVAAALLAPLAPRLANAQSTGLVDDETFVFADSNTEVTWDRPWSYDEDISSVEDGEGLIALTAAPSSLLLISIIPDLADLEEARDIVLGELEDSADDFEQIDRGSYDNVSYSLDLADLDGAEIGSFTLVIGDAAADRTSVFLFFAPVDAFSDGMVDAQENVEVENVPLFEGVEPPGLQDLLEDRDGGNRGDEESYTDRTFDYTVEWSGDWLNADDSIVAPADLSSGADLALVNESVPAIVRFIGVESGGVPPVLIVDELAATLEEDSEFERARADIQVVDDDGLLIVLTGRLDSEPVVQLFELIVLPDDQNALVLTAPEQDIAETVESFQSDVSINGDPPLRQWEDVQDEFD
ncbi:MAG: hypothetical protein H0W06_04240 [Chloroflexia bacterium]|nr:hypothetical protein [Chloroflexia bacterium]